MTESPERPGPDAAINRCTGCGAWLPNNLTRCSVCRRADEREKFAAETAELRNNRGWR